MKEFVHNKEILNNGLSVWLDCYLCSVTGGFKLCKYEEHAQEEGESPIHALDSDIFI